MVTSPWAANRVYSTGSVHFVGRDQHGRLQDAQGTRWHVAEDAVESEADGRRLPRVPARRAFWFGCYAQFPETDLVR